MDLKLFKQDIDELINEFVECDSTTFAEFKRVWLSRKFSYIFEASPSTNQAFFMQSLYAHSINSVMMHLISNTQSTAPEPGIFLLLGGLYCLYCLFETQPFNPPFKLYLSLEELRQLKNFVVEAKAAGVKVVAALVKGMLERNMFLFGYVGVNEGSATERVNELTDIQNARIQTAYKKLFANSRLEHFIHMDLGTDLDVDLFKKRSSEYAAAKKLAIKEASQVVDVENIKHITENERLIGDVVEKTAADWNAQKETLYGQTGFSPPVAEQEEDEDEYSRGQNSNGSKKQKEPCDDDNLEEDPEDFCKELEETLLLQPLDCDNDEEGE